MKSYINRFSELECGWNERELTEDDFFRLCDRFRIIANLEKMRIRGVYYRLLQRDFISISSRLSPLQRSFVMFHELGHFLMHAPGRTAVASFSGFCPETREETEADAFASCALLPLTLLMSRPGEELADIYGSRFFMKRLEVYERYGI